MEPVFSLYLYSIFPLYLYSVEYKYEQEVNKHEFCGDDLELEVLELKGFNKYK